MKVKVFGVLILVAVLASIPVLYLIFAAPAIEPAGVSGRLLCLAQRAEPLVFPKNIKSLSLDSCIEMAKENNPDILTMGSAVNRAGEYFTDRTGLTADDIRALFKRVADGINQTVEEAVKYGISQNREGSSLRTEAETFLIYAVRIAFNQLQMSCEALEAQKKCHDLSQSIVTQSESRFKAGTASFVDVLEDKINFQDVEKMLSVSEAEASLTRNALACLLGFSHIPDSVSVPPLQRFKVVPAEDSRMRPYAHLPSSNWQQDEMNRIYQRGLLHHKQLEFILQKYTLANERCKLMEELDRQSGTVGTRSITQAKFASACAEKEIVDLVFLINNIKIHLDILAGCPF